jgi:GNAT superfamily N-acetyltransferase
MRLRPYRSGDHSALVDIWYESWLSIGLQKPRVTRDDLARRFPDDLARRWTLTVAEIDGQVVGFLALCLGERRLDQIFVSPAAQGCGVGKALFEAATQLLPEGFWLGTHPGNHRARAFYERRGMSVAPAHEQATDDRVIYVFHPRPA